MSRPASRAWGLRAAVCVLVFGAPLASCAYYNTFYKAKDYYNKATPGVPYPIDKADPATVGNFNKSIEYSKKLMAVYPTSKWVDDAYLLWARSLIGKEDPLQTINMLRDFSTRYPNSTLKNEAKFYLAVAARKARKYAEAQTAIDEFLAAAPKHDLASYALLERAQILVALGQPGPGAEAASQAVKRFSKGKQRDRAILVRAEALLAQGETERARADFQTLGTRALTDEERFGFLLREADCLSAERRYDDEAALLREALAHELEPRLPAPGTTQMMPASNPASADRWGRLMVRIGTAHALAGRMEPALQSYRRVVEGFPRTVLAAEAQYRIGYLHETLGDDFEAARLEYAKVQTHQPASQYTAQANQRLTNLTRLSQYRSAAGPDSAGRKAEAGFLLAEQYLFQLDKPDRALEEYRKISTEWQGTPQAGKALNAEAWLLRNKLGRDAAADSVLWAVVRNYPKTEAQVDARDYLERYGHQVPEDLIQLPEPRVATLDTVPLSSPPVRTDSIGVRRVPTGMDSLLRLGMIRAGDQPVYNTPPAATAAPAVVVGPDSLRARADTLSTPPPPSVPDSVSTPPPPSVPDTSRAPSAADSSAGPR